MIFLQELVHNEILMSAGLSWALAQVIKTIIHLILTKKFVAERLIGSGGMPSCHSATVCALTTSVIINEGIHSPFFAIAAILSIIVMYDAMMQSVGIIFEFKFTDDMKKLPDKCREALEQIEKNKYETELEDLGVKKVIRYGIAFCKKVCKVSVAK
jgi:hypothetical protein